MISHIWFGNGSSLFFAICSKLNESHIDWVNLDMVYIPVGSLYLITLRFLVGCPNGIRALIYAGIKCLSRLTRELGCYYMVFLIYVVGSLSNSLSFWD